MALSDLIPAAAKSWASNYVTISPKAGSSPEPQAAPNRGPVAQGGLFGKSVSGYRAPTTHTPLSSSNNAKPLERREAAQVARKLRAELGIIKALFENTARFSLGSGLQPTSMCRDKEWADMANDIFEAVSTSKTFDVREGLTFKQMQKLVLPDVICDGDAGAAPTRGPNGDPRLQLFPMHAIGSCAGESIFDGRGEWEDGLMRGPEGAKVAFRILKNNKLGAAGRSRGFFDYPAASFYHIGRADRILGNRPMSWLYHGDKSAAKILDLNTLEMAAKTLNSYFAAAIKTRSGDMPDALAGMMARHDDDVDEVVDPDAPEPTAEEKASQVEKLEQRVIDFYGVGGAILPLEKDQEFQFFKNDRDTTSTTDFIQYLITDIATGFGVPWQFIWGVSGMAGPYARMIMQQADWFFTDVADMMVGDFCQPVWEGIIQDAMTPTMMPNGRIQGPILRAPRAGSNWRAVQWQGPGSMTIDKGRDGKLYIEMIKSGIGRRSKWNQMTGNGGMAECFAAIDEIQELIKYCDDTEVPHQYYFGSEFAKQGISAPHGGGGPNADAVAASVVSMLVERGLIREP